ncbi:MAG TPA: tail fiber protein [Rhizomicrobium sp.]|nr:tail fiber protein [Rhizomicrobium sp.]
MSTPFLSQIETFSFNFAPKGWTLCNGQLLPINQNQALFSLLGTTYGGDGRVNFALPDLRSRVPVSQGGSTGITLGQRGGTEAVTINITTMPQHNHLLMTDNNNPTANTPANTNVLAKNQGVASTGATFGFAIYSGNPPNNTAAPNIIGNVGGSQAHTNIMPYLCISFCIALQGIFPSQT